MSAKTCMILMADIVDSRFPDQKKLLYDFKSIIDYINNTFPNQLISPLTITLGDEFQSITKNLSAALKTIFDIEEAIINKKKNFKLRYVLVEGEVETVLNKKNAHGMMGKGLTIARTQLNKLKKSKNRFNIKLKNEELSEVLNDTYFIAQNFIDSWVLEKDFNLVSEFIKHNDYKIVADILMKDRSQIWKRERTLKLEAYFSIKKVIKYIGGQYV